MCEAKSYSRLKNLSFKTFLDCYQILTELRLFLGRFNLSLADHPRYTGGPSAPASLVIQLLRCTGVGLTEAYRAVRGYLADRPRLLSGHIIGVTEAYRCIWRTVRGPWADCPRYNFSADKSLWWKSSWMADSPPLTRGPSALPNFRQPRILPTFTISTLNWDYCSNNIPKISKLASTPSKDSYEWVRMRNQK